ncbi:DUF445 domain-containing protein [Mitsuokella sp.]|uniref:DUF445 domain-containing protein n=1 Tax=Mitsuokella TaxID=52225 RepID=UPI0029E502A3|nr:DUF445 family protein [Mitsuokella sp.]MDD6381912.1 DUF445 family protein [Selenomonadaceae bacterium]MDY4475848.1 DUF445 family protein [Mitsuokella sp.]
MIEYIKSWNKADRVLLFAFLLFLLALYLHLQWPGSAAASGFLFCAEAALVGGIADWFAVTALFRKPLGFPYHTAILPRRRQAFIKASVTMVQKEFFSRRKVFHHLERLHLMPMLMKWLGEPDTRAKVSHHLYHYARSFLLRQDSEQKAAEFAQRIRAHLSTMEPEELFAHIGQWLQASGRDKEFLAKITAYLREKAMQPGTARAIERLLEQYEREKAKSTLALFLTGLAEAMDLVNLEDAAKLMQKQLVAMLTELGTRDSELQQDMLALFYEKTALLNAEPEFHQLVHELRDNLVAELPIEEVVNRAAAHMREHFEADAARQVDAVEEHLPVLRSRLAEILEAEYDRGLHLMQEDDELRRVVGHFLYDLIARSALHAQTLVGVIVRSVLSRLTDEQLNHLVYDKVEPDLLWIRMNGSIVGAGIGLVLYGLLQLLS